jgi:hypothetical protein
MVAADGDVKDDRGEENDSGERPVSAVFAVAAAQGGSEKEGKDERGR